MYMRMNDLYYYYELKLIYFMLFCILKHAMNVFSKVMPTTLGIVISSIKLHHVAAM